MLDGTPPISLAESSDLPAVTDLLREAHLPIEGVDSLVGGLLVARVGDRIVGSAGLEIYGTAAVLRSVAVRAGFRGGGLGGRLARAAIAMAADRGVRRLYLLTETAPEFFARLGFRPIERRDVDAEVRRSPEFAVLCPATALAMVLER